MRLSRDGVPVVIHDATLRRTGLAAGSVARMAAEQLAGVDVGSWFNRANLRLAREKFAQERIPTLHRVFELCRKRSGVIYVEMKADRQSRINELVTVVAEQIKKFELSERAIVVSFDHQAVAAVKTVDSSIRTGALFAPRQGIKGWRAQTILSAAAQCGADEILLHRLLARRTLIDRCHQQHLPVVVWTVDDPKWLARAKNLGIHALITNNPATFVAA